MLPRSRGKGVIKFLALTSSVNSNLNFQAVNFVSESAWIRIRRGLLDSDPLRRCGTGFKRKVLRRRRRIKTEEMTKVVNAVWGTELSTNYFPSG